MKHERFSEFELGRSEDELIGGEMEEGGGDEKKKVVSSGV